ncbi:MAG: (2Fe-2S) ferredoxin domain-containing protein [Eubacteriales bacterium]|nr:(2Fe-2S) ferredoxin domain-containing protein [Eubacteriales bacterium]
MKSLAELQAIREKMQNQINMRSEDEKVRIVVGMATCGIAAGARPVLNALSDEIQKRNLTDKVSVTQTGCIGLCQYEPIIEVYEKDKEKVTYIKMDAEKAVEVIERHIVGGHVVDKYSMGASGLK